MASTQFRALHPISHGYIRTDADGNQLKHPDGSFDVQTQEFAAGDVLENFSSEQLVHLVKTGKAQSFDAAQAAADAQAAVVKAQADLAKANAAAAAASSKDVADANAQLAAHPAPAAAVEANNAQVAAGVPLDVPKAPSVTEVKPQDPTVGREVV